MTGMGYYLAHDLIFHLIVFQAIILLVILSNLWIMRRARRHPPPTVYPLVSILIPARDEERNIARCVQSLLAQDYPAYEVLVLDDGSSDGTRSILDALALTQPRLRVLSGSPLPEGFLGKSWACSQLSKHARGELLLFTDADTTFMPDALKSLVATLDGEGADLLTGLPRQEVHTWGERLLVPFFSWVLLSLTPLALVYRLRKPALAIAVGQMLLLRRKAYQAVGGHESLGASIVDDLTLTRRIQAAGFRWRAAHIADLVSCRMYHSSGEALNGFIKNLFAAFDFRLLLFLFAFFWLAMMFWEPLIVLLLRIFGQAPQAQVGALIGCVGLAVSLWLIPYIALRIPFGLAFLYPLTILANEVAACQSLRRSLSGTLSWKGRKMTRPRWRWL